MKITNELLSTLNAGFEDLTFELGVLSRLDELGTDENLANYLNQEFELDEVLDADGEPSGDFEVSHEEKERDAFKVALKLIGADSKQSLLDLLSQRHNKTFTDLQAFNSFVESVKDDLIVVAQLDRVQEGLARFNATSETLNEIEEIKNTQLNRLLGTLLQKVEN